MSDTQEQDVPTEYDALNQTMQEWARELSNQRMDDALTTLDRQSTPPDDYEIRYIPARHLLQVTSVFQPRETAKTDRAHVNTLAKNLKEKSALDPIYVIPVEANHRAVKRARQTHPELPWFGLGTQQFYVVVDGHHRLAAYKVRHGKAATVKVKVLPEAPTKAALRSGVANTKAKKPMSERERSEYAWRLTCAFGNDGRRLYSAKQVANAASVQQRTVKKMRHFYREFHGKWPKSDPTNFTWWQIRQAINDYGATDKNGWTEDELHAEIERAQRKLQATLNEGYVGNEQVLPQALARVISPEQLREALNAQGEPGQTPDDPNDGVQEGQDAE